MFQFPGFASRRKVGMTEVYSDGFPHSDISGSKVARHLPEAYRSRATSFVASSSQGIHRMPLGFLSGNLTTASYTSVIERCVCVVSGALNANATGQVCAWLNMTVCITATFSIFSSTVITTVDIFPMYSVVNVLSCYRYLPFFQVSVLFNDCKALFLKEKTACWRFGMCVLQCARFQSATSLDVQYSS